MNKFKVLAVGATAALVFSTGSMATHASANAATAPTLTSGISQINLARYHHHRRGLVKCYFSGYRPYGYRRYVRWSTVGYSKRHAFRKARYLGRKYRVRYIRFHGCRYYGYRRYR